MYKPFALVLFAFSILLLSGGLLGYLVAHSTVSLIAASLSALLVVISGVLVLMQRKGAALAATYLMILLGAFFLFRVWKTGHWMPAGFLAFSALAIALWGAVLTRKKMIR